jgi:hypothetical protein
MKAGVATRPCGVTNSPRRAAPSVLITWKEKEVAMLTVVMAGLVPAIHVLRAASF